MKLNLGAGHVKSDGYLRCDIAGDPDVRCDIRWLPFKGGSFDEIVAHHILEHVSIDDRVSVFNECHRVMEDGGRMDIEVPIFPFWQAIADPTHRSFFVAESFEYFSEGTPLAENSDLYGINLWKMKRRDRMGWGQALHVELVK